MKIHTIFYFKNKNLCRKRRLSKLLGSPYSIIYLKIYAYQEINQPMTTHTWNHNTADEDMRNQPNELNI